MQIAKIENDEVIATGEHTQLFPETSFPHEGPNDEFLTENGCLPVLSYIPHNVETEELKASSVYIKDGAVYTVTVEPKTESVVLDEVISITSTADSVISFASATTL